MVILQCRIIKDCSSSVASGIRYQYDCNRRKGETTPIHGTYTRGLVELTHPVLGGDTSYLRLEHGYEWIQSWGRRMPDTGYQKPLSRSHFNAQAKSKSTNSLVDSDLFSQEWNRPQMSETETEKNDKFTMSHQILGWLSPGIVSSFFFSDSCINVLIVTYDMSLNRLRGQNGREVYCYLQSY